jgi:hypothetical protein
MNEKPYQLAGILAIVQAVLFPLGFLIAITQQILLGVKFHHTGPIMGPSDGIFIAFTVIGIYVLIKFRQLLNERYNFHAINTLITLVIGWSIIFQVVSLLVRILFAIFWPVDESLVIFLWLPIMVISLIAIGVLDLFIAARLLKQKEKFTDLINAFAYVTLVAGICELTILLAPVALILVPVTNVVLGMIFLREKEEVDFV